MGLEKNLDHEQEKDRIGNYSQKGRDEDSGDSFKESKRKGLTFRSQLLLVSSVFLPQSPSYPE